MKIFGVEIKVDWDTGVENKPTIDSTPTENSTNAVSSGGAFTALASKVDKPNTAADGNVAVFDANKNIVDKNIHYSLIGIA